jgi:pyruvate dehydrogenase E1 component
MSDVKDPPFGAPSPAALQAMQVIRDHVAKGALSMIDWANNKPENRGKKPKVGGHQASSMSSVDLLCALYLGCRRPVDRVAVKPHAAPVVYSLMHLLGVLPKAAMDQLREKGGPQPYPTKLKSPRFVDYTTSSEALGVCATIYDAYGAVHHNRALAPALNLAPIDGIYWAHCGDGELTEGQIDESLYDAGRWGLDNLIWIVDLNRQSLDRVMDDSGRLEDWVTAKFRGQGWETLSLRWGSGAEALFQREGGQELRKVLEGAPDTVFHPLLMLDGAAQRQALLGGAEHPDAERQHALTWFRDNLQMSATRRRGIRRALEGLEDRELHDGLTHLGGHDLGALIGAYSDAAAVTGRPAVVIAHTLKGYQTSAAGHPENHGMLLPSAEVAAWGADRGVSPGERYPTPASDSAAAELLTACAAPFLAEPEGAYSPAPLEGVAEQLNGVRLAARKTTSTGGAFQSLNMAILRTPVGPWLQFAAPDVGQTTHLGPVIKAKGVFAPRDVADPYGWLRQARQSAFDWRPTTDGQFHALGIAEGNAYLWAYAFGRQRKLIEGKSPLLPVVTVYDKFVERGFNQLDYACYSGARFIAVGVPSGTGLSRETATHQSIQTLRMVMDLPGVIAYEPAFGADVHAIYLHALSQLWEEGGEAVYLRLSTQPLDQPEALPEDHAEAAVRGAYWLVGEDAREARAGAGEVLFIASGRKLAQAREAARQLHAEDGVGSRILNVTSYEALWRDWDQFADDPSAWEDPERSYLLHDLFSNANLNAPLLITGDHVPSVAEWLPGALMRVRGHRFLGPRRNGEAGALEAIDALHGMATEDLVRVAREELTWRRELP